MLPFPPSSHALSPRHRLCQGCMPGGAPLLLQNVKNSEPQTEVGKSVLY